MGPRVRLAVRRKEGIASLPVRAFGGAIDFIVLEVPLGVFLSRLFGDTSTTFAVLSVAGAALYFIPLFALTGRTVGCRSAGVRLDAAGTTSAPGWLRATARWATPIVFTTAGRVVLAVTGVTLPGVGWLLYSAAIVLILYLPALCDSKRRSLPDRVAGTIVRLAAPT